MTFTFQNKKRIPIIPVMVFLLAFSAVVWYGYTHFIQKDVKPVQTATGLNSKLPSVTETKPLNKLELYMQAEKDSAARKEQQSNDPYHKMENFPVEEKLSLAIPKYKSTGRIKFRPTGKEHIDGNEEKFQKQIQEIRKKITSNAERISTRPDVESEKEKTVLTPPSEVVPLPREATEGVVARVDPDLIQLDGMLDKLLDIQHPEMVKQRLVKNDNAVIRSSEGGVRTKSVEAVVHNTQIVTNGSVLKIRILKELTINALTIPKGSFVYGTCTLASERLNVQLSHVSFQNQLLPVSFSVYDIDGIEGIYIPGAVSVEAGKEGADQAIQSINLEGYDPSLTGRIAGVGVNAAKNLLSKKVRLVRVTVKAGHHILLTSGNIQ